MYWHSIHGIRKGKLEMKCPKCYPHLIPQLETFYKFIQKSRSDIFLFYCSHKNRISSLHICHYHITAVIPDRRCIWMSFPLQEEIRPETGARPIQTSLLYRVLSDPSSRGNTWLESANIPENQTKQQHKM